MHRRRCLIPTLLLFITGALGCDAQSPDETTSRHTIPARWDLAPPASVAAGGFSSDPYQRDEQVLSHFLQGNLPDYLRTLVPVEVKEVINDEVVTGVVWVMPDYLTLGTDEDALRMPMNPITAQKIADAYGMTLPTRKLVDYFYYRAEVKTAPIPTTPDAAMTTTPRFVQHHALVDAALPAGWQGKLLAGHKKDMVVSNRLLAKPTSVAIYGWHLLSGSPIQPLSTVHGNYYVDYSHGARLLSATMQVDGKDMLVEEVMAHPTLHVLISDEGPLQVTRYDTTALNRRKWNEWVELD